MNERFLISVILKQITELTQGIRASLEVSRLDSRRDYIDIRDVASAILALLKTDKLTHHAYNVGSGNDYSNELLIKHIIEEFRIAEMPKMIELQNTPEAPVASKADITRITTETGWRPKYSLHETIKEITKYAK